jgi:hypothetical protein
MLKLRHIIVFVLCLLVLAFVLSRRSTPPPDSVTIGKPMVVDGETIPGVVLGPDSPCVHDWTKCRDADDLLKHDERHRNIKHGCEYSAWGALAGSYWYFAETIRGKPWPFPFKWDGIDYHNGIITLVPRVIQNEGKAASV